jgi:hypothetical protein
MTEVSAAVSTLACTASFLDMYAINLGKQCHCLLALLYCMGVQCTSAGGVPAGLFAVARTGFDPAALHSTLISDRQRCWSSCAGAGCCMQCKTVVGQPLVCVLCLSVQVEGVMQQLTKQLQLTEEHLDLMWAVTEKVRFCWVRQG